MNLDFTEWVDSTNPIKKVDWTEKSVVVYWYLSLSCQIVLICLHKPTVLKGATNKDSTSISINQTTNMSLNRTFIFKTAIKQWIRKVMELNW